MNDMECPYCGASCDVDHDDGQGYEEDVKHEQECSECEKTFVFMTSISFHYTPAKADCLNGAEHDWRPSITYPVEYTKGVCSNCWLERKATPEDMEKLKST